MRAVCDNVQTCREYWPMMAAMIKTPHVAA